MPLKYFTMNQILQSFADKTRWIQLRVIQMEKAMVAPNLRTEIKIFGSDGSVSAANSDVVTRPSQGFSGSHTTQHLESGIQYSVTDILTDGNIDYKTTMPRSLCLLISINGDTSDMKHGRNGSLKLDAGEVAFIHVADKSQLIGNLRKKQNTKSVLIQLNEDIVRDNDLQQLIHIKTSSSRINTLGLQPRIAHLGMALSDRKNCGIINKMMAESYAYEAIAQAIKLTVDSRRNIYSHSHSDLLKMSIVKDKIRTHPEMDHSLTDLAHEVGLSVSGLKTKFRDIYGKPVFQYLREVRMLCAHHGIEQQGWTIQQAAFFAGYKHPENFSTAFQKIFGVLPSKIF